MLRRILKRRGFEKGLLLHDFYWISALKSLVLGLIPRRGCVDGKRSEGKHR
jgi:hypothetical protein